MTSIAEECPINDVVNYFSQHSEGEIKEGDSHLKISIKPFLSLHDRVSHPRKNHPKRIIDPNNHIAEIRVCHANGNETMLIARKIVELLKSVNIITASCIEGSGHKGCWVERMDATLEPDTLGYFRFRPGNTP